MIKRVIFDIDDTLFPWKKEYFEEIKEVLKNLKIEYTNEEYNKIIKSLSEYENEYYIFDKKLMLTYINEYTKKEYPETFINNIIKRWESCAPDKINLETIETLEYLKSKYELVTLTDWYKKQQEERLRKAGILKYFETVYSAEKTKRKPFKEAFMQAIGGNRPEECIMIGNDLERDIKGAMNAGLKAIWYNPKNSKISNKDYLIISKIEKLKEIL